jgi:hypothetical protein
MTALFGLLPSPHFLFRTSRQLYMASTDGRRCASWPASPRNAEPPARNITHQSTGAFLVVVVTSATTRPSPLFDPLAVEHQHARCV